MILILHFFEETECVLFTVFPNFQNKVLENFHPIVVDKANQIQSWALYKFGLLYHLHQRYLQTFYEAHFAFQICEIVEMIIKSSSYRLVETYRSKYLFLHQPTPDFQLIYLLSDVFPLFSSYLSIFHHFFFFIILLQYSVADVGQKLRELFFFSQVKNTLQAR